MRAEAPQQAFYGGETRPPPLERFEAASLGPRCPDRCPLLSALFNVRPSAAGLYDFYSLSLSFAHVAVALTETSVPRAVSSPVYWVRCGMD